VVGSLGRVRARIVEGMEDIAMQFMQALNLRDEGRALALLDRVDIHGSLTGDGQTALHGAARFGCALVTRELLARGAPLEARTHGGSTPLIMAAGAGHVAVVAVLLGAGADARAKTEAGYTARDVAETNGRAEAVRFLTARATS